MFILLLFYCFFSLYFCLAPDYIRHHLNHLPIPGSHSQLVPTKSADSLLTVPDCLKHCCSEWRLEKVTGYAVINKCGEVYHELIQAWDESLRNTSIVSRDLCCDLRPSKFRKAFKKNMIRIQTHALTLLKLLKFINY